MPSAFWAHGSVSYTPAGGVATIVPGTEPTTVAISNTFTSGSLTIVKDVSGVGVPAFSQGPFVFDIVCDFDGVDAVFSTSGAIEGDPTGATVQCEPITVGHAPAWPPTDDQLTRSLQLGARSVRLTRAGGRSSPLT